MKKNEVAEAISKDQMLQMVDAMISLIEANPEARWVDELLARAWPMQANGDPYSGSNVMWLMFRAKELKSNDPRWFSFLEAKKRGWHVRAGESATKTVTWKKFTWAVKDKDGSPKLDEDGDQVFGCKWYPVAYHNVFNACQIEGVDTWHPELKADGDYSDIDTLIASWSINGPKYEENEMVRTPCYSPSKDKVSVPARRLFISSAAFTSAVAHEGAHATGHKSRLAREYGSIFKSKEYAIEEITAQLAASLWCSRHGINFEDKQFRNDAAYVASWLKGLKKGDDSNVDWITHCSVAAVAAAQLLEKEYQNVANN